MVQPLWKTIWQIPREPEIALSGIYPREEVHVHAKTCTQMFIAALLIKAPNCKHPRCLSMSD